jgi:drug/metabolite transporter (DMT)-like permease
MPVQHISTPLFRTGYSDNLSGMALAAVAFALLTSVDTIFKLMAVGHPACQILVVNGVFALAPILLWTFLTGGLKRLRTTRPLQHMARGSASVLSAYAAIFAYSRLPLTDFYTVLFTGPLIVTALSSFWLGERIDNARWLAIGAGFCGIILTVNPFTRGPFMGGVGPQDALAVGRFAALISVFGYALSVLMIRRMRGGETNMTFSFYGYLASISIGAALLVIKGGTPLSASDIGHLALSGTLAGISSICMMTAYHRAPVALVAPFQYTQIIWGALAGYMLWAQMPTLRLICGAGVVAASGLFVIYREMRPRIVAG